MDNKRKQRHVHIFCYAQGWKQNKNIYAMCSSVEGTN